MWKSKFCVDAVSTLDTVSNSGMMFNVMRAIDPRIKTLSPSGGTTDDCEDE